MSAKLLGRTNWSLQWDEKGHRTYDLEWLVETSSPEDGPRTVFNCPDLPQVGDMWIYGSDYDPWAFCSHEADCTPVVSKEPNCLWIVNQKFSTIPKTRCQDESIKDPLEEPDRIRGSFVRYTKTGRFDKDGKPIKSSSHEFLVGPETEFDHNRPSVDIEKTLLQLPLSTFAAMIDTVNDSPLWGLPKRCVKLSNASWQRLLYGTCSYYYTVAYNFDIDYNTWDREVGDIGRRVLNGVDGVNGVDKSKPEHFIVAKDVQDEIVENVILDGNGNQWKGENADPGGAGKIKVEFYKESNFLSLGIPTSF